MHYLVTIGYESEEQLTRSGLPRIQKEKYMVEAESVEEVTIIMAKYCADDSRGSDVLSIVHSPIACVIDPKNTPAYFTQSKVTA